MSDTEHDQVEKYRLKDGTEVLGRPTATENLVKVTHPTLGVLYLREEDAEVVLEKPRIPEPKHTDYALRVYQDGEQAVYRRLTSGRWATLSGTECFPDWNQLVEIVELGGQGIFPLIKDLSHPSNSLPFHHVDSDGDAALLDKRHSNLLRMDVLGPSGAVFFDREAAGNLAWTLLRYLGLAG